MSNTQGQGENAVNAEVKQLPVELVDTLDVHIYGQNVIIVAAKYDNNKEYNTLQHGEPALVEWPMYPPVDINNSMHVGIAVNRIANEWRRAAQWKRLNECPSCIDNMVIAKAMDYACSVTGSDMLGEQHLAWMDMYLRSQGK